jgi:hypothetical protein
MNKKLIVVTFIFSSILITGIIIGIWAWQETRYRSESRELGKKITEAEDKVNKTRNAEDEKGYSPSDVVRNFVTEVKNDSAEKAKLYLSKDKQGLDIKASLGFDKELDKITVQDISYSIGNDSATVRLQGFWPTEDKTFEKNFVLIKEDNLWKISKIKGA